MGHQPLVELVFTGDEYGERRLARASGATNLLPHRCDRAGEAVEHAGVEATDVDAELEGRGGDHAAHLAVEELVLDLASLLGEIAAAIGAHALGELLGKPPAHISGDDLGAPSTATEPDRLVAAAD